MGRRGPSFAPLELEQEAPFGSMHDLLAAIVRDQVAGFQARKEEVRLLRVLTERAIEQGAETGKLAFGDQLPDERSVNADDAVAAAVTAFEDGFFYMFVNEVQVERLDQAVLPREVTDVLFIRLTPLAGG